MEGFTDITSLYEFSTIAEGSTWRMLFYSNLTLCSGTIFAHLMMAIVQYRRKGRAAVLKEWGIIMCFLKVRGASEASVSSTTGRERDERGGEHHEARAQRRAPRDGSAEASTTSHDARAQRRAP
jgi:hypothetical protein